jgi:hypothetical protein
MFKSTCTAVLASSLVTLAASFSAGHANAQTPFSVSASIGDFHVAVANYYHVPEREVIVIRERRIPDDEIPVALFIARHASVPWTRVVDMRLRGDSWWDISVRLGVQPDVYYIPVAVAPGPPYGRALGHYKKKHRKEWRTIVLTDADVVNLVELRFLSEHYHVAPERIIEMRGRDRDFVAIHADVRGGGKGKDSDSRDMRASREQDSQGQNSQGKGRGKGRGKKD